MHKLVAIACKPELRFGWGFASWELQAKHIGAAQ